MLILPIKKKWFEMIVSGEKKEEYREVSPYYTIRFLNIMGYNQSRWKEILTKLKIEETKEEYEIALRNGYSSGCPTIVIRFTLSIGTGRAIWGAAPNTEYFRLHIKGVRKY